MGSATVSNAPINQYKHRKKSLSSFPDLFVLLFLFFSLPRTCFSGAIIRNTKGGQSANVRTYFFKKFADHILFAIFGFADLRICDLRTRFFADFYPYKYKPQMQSFKFKEDFWLLGQFELLFIS